MVPDDVRDVGRFVYGLADGLRSAMASAASDVDGVLSSSWLGDYADEFAAGWKETHDGGVHIIDALTAMAEKLGVTAENYRVTDESSRSSLLQISDP